LLRSRQFCSSLWIPKVHYRVHNSPPPVSILNQIDPVYRSHPISLRSILIFPIHLRLGLPSCLLLSGFPTNILYAFLFSHSYYMPCPSHSPSPKEYKSYYYYYYYYWEEHRASLRLNQNKSPALEILRPFTPFIISDNYKQIQFLRCRETRMRSTAYA
jgi:hypothetical protein